MYMVEILTPVQYVANVYGLPPSVGCVELMFSDPRLSSDRPVTSEA